MRSVFGILDYIQDKWFSIFLYSQRVSNDMISDNVKALSKGEKNVSLLNVIVNEYLALVEDPKDHFGNMGKISAHSICMDTSHFSNSNIDSLSKRVANCGLHANFKKAFIDDTTETLNKAFFNMPDSDGSIMCAVYVITKTGGTILLNGCEGFDVRSRSLTINSKSYLQRKLNRSALYQNMVISKLEAVMCEEFGYNYNLNVRPYILTYPACVAIDSDFRILRGDRALDSKSNETYFWTMRESSEYITDSFNIDCYNRHCCNVIDARKIEADKRMMLNLR